MGWTYPIGMSRKALIADRIIGWEREVDGVTVKSTCLAHCYRGNCFSGVLWSVWQRTFERGCQQTEPEQRWIQCDLLRCDQGEWGYKDLEESSFPYYYSCPQKYLDLVPIEQFGGNEKWREQVRLYHEKQAEKRRRKRSHCLMADASTK